MFMDRKTQYHQDVSSFQINLQIQCDPNQNPSIYPDSKVYTERQRPRVANAILQEKSKVGGLTLFEFKTLYEATVTKTKSYW